MKKRHILIILALFGIINACNEDFLNIRPKGALDQSVLATEKGINALLVGAYSMMDGITANFGWEAASSNWVYGDIRGMIANKGTDAGDQPDINPIQSYTETATNPYLNTKWREVYEAVSRCNSTIMVVNEALGAGTITQEQADLFTKQAKALRGWYHFEAWRMWEMIPYVDENAVQTELTNTEDVRDKIIADLTEGITLPLDMGAVGKFNKTVCQVILAKAKMQMYQDYAGALPLLQEVKTSGKKANNAAIGLATTYGEIFDIPNRNGIECVYTVQYSVNDGSGANNAGAGEVLNFPYKSGASPGGCCGFFCPTQEYVNSYRTSGGLPLLDYSYNSDPVINDQGVAVNKDWKANLQYDSLATTPGAIVTIVDPAEPANRQVKAYKSLIVNNKGNNPLTSPAAWVLYWQEDPGPLDPRLDWAVGRRGIPYWDWGIHTGSDWIRDQSYAGPYNGKKQVYQKSQERKYTDISSWTSGYTANGYRMIRYADVLLLLAECQIETGALADARTNINLVRARAANAAGFVKEADGTTNAANYVISEYPLTGYPFDNQANARLALRMERKLELGMEGHRWFDLNRWGITETELTRVLTYEKTTPWGKGTIYQGADIGPEDATFPVPQRQIDLTNGKIVQNR